MKKLPIKKILDTLESQHFHVQMETLKKSTIDVAILEQVDILLGFVYDKGIKLTPPQRKTSLKNHQRDRFLQTHKK